jgi:hypothetical protein
MWTLEGHDSHADTNVRLPGNDAACVVGQIPQPGDAAACRDGMPWTVRCDGHGRDVEQAA